MDRREYATGLVQAARQPHEGVFITGPGRIEVLTDSLDANAFDEAHVVTASLGNLRCVSDSKAIKQFSQHARVPKDGRPVALGHETLQVIVQAPPSTGLKVGDVVTITPGHSATPINPDTFQPDREKGILPSLGYSYRQCGGLRRFNVLPVSAIEFVRSQGFGTLYNTVPKSSLASTSLASLAHAEPFACNYGTNKYIFQLQGRNFILGVPPKSNLAYLGGTARMAMINLTIVASQDKERLPRVVSITGSQKKLDELARFKLITDLQAKGVIVELIDRAAPDIVARLTKHGQADVVWTNFAAAEIYEQAAAIIAPGGNINNYAGAADPDLVLRMRIAAHPAQTQEAAFWLKQMHHQVSANAPDRFWGLEKSARVHLADFTPVRKAAWLTALPAGTTVVDSDSTLAAQYPKLRFDSQQQGLTDVFIAGSGQAAADRYFALELCLARGAAVALVDGNTTINIRSKLSHYTTRHQICGPNVPWSLTNTSEPHADDMAVQARQPVDFDWMVRGICGLRHVPDMMAEVESSQPFGSFFAFTELPDLPWVHVSEEAFTQAAAQHSGVIAAALQAGAKALHANKGLWGRSVEEAMYRAYGVPYPLV